MAPTPTPHWIVVNGILYGTTFNGGSYQLGTVFSLNPTSGVETVLYSFAGGSDGAFPVAALIDVNGKLYGTTSEGGTQNSACYTGGCGTVFSVDLATGKEKVVYAFCQQQQNCADGQYPLTNLIHVNGALYGTTAQGGVSAASRRGGDLGCTGSNCGTVFSLDPKTGAETVLHSFAGGSDGAYPSPLINVKGTLYGTTGAGGATGNGTVFSVDPSTGAEAILYSFNCCVPDGWGPDAGLLNVHGALYGTTMYGGGTGCGGEGCGTIFSITTSGTENVVHAFQGGYDGARPEAGLIDVNDMLFGTTHDGGQLGNRSNGTIFTVGRKTGEEKVIYPFQGPPDGASPGSALIEVNGTLYGTTVAGGTGTNCGFGCGTVFALTRQ